MPAVSRFREWRGHRPFAGGLLLVLGGAEILLTMKAPLPVMLKVGMQGLAGYLLPSLMIVCGLLILFNPTQRLFYSILGIMLSLGTWLTSNIGGFVVGLLMGAVGSTLAFGWLPDQEPRPKRSAKRREKHAVELG
ncbi:membrane protein [Streptomyces scabiei]|nr:membrane protein [Streptomyces scabiei]